MPRSPSSPRHGLVLLVLQEPPDQLRARIHLFFRDVVVLLVLRLLWEEHLALDVGQRRRHHEVLARDVEVQLLHHRHILQIALGHERDRQVENVQLVLADQVQEQVERPFEGAQA